MDRAQLADFLRKRREALRPEDVGLVVGSRRRTEGLRREEVAALCGMSPDYVTRLEQQRSPKPSDQMLAAIARGLRLTLDERDHLFRLAGHNAPMRALRTDHVSPGMMRVLDRLDDTPAQVVTGWPARCSGTLRTTRARSEALSTGGSPIPMRAESTPRKTTRCIAAPLQQTCVAP
jgi:transcriptional regulator with XRE-family HTH domain